jgi:hypothetical protein
MEINNHYMGYCPAAQHFFEIIETADLRYFRKNLNEGYREITSDAAEVYFKAFKQTNLIKN